MSNLQITLPDGSVQTLPEGARPIDAAQKISSRLADDAIVALGFEQSATPTPEELTAKAATLRKPSDDEIGKELAGFAVGTGILAPAERVEWERRLAKDRENLNCSSLAFLKLASIHLMLRRPCIF